MKHRKLRKTIHASCVSILLLGSFQASFFLPFQQTNTVNADAITGPEITEQPKQKVRYAATVPSQSQDGQKEFLETFKARATGNGYLTYQWKVKKPGESAFENVEGQTTPVLQGKTPTTTGTYIYKCEITNNKEGFTSTTTTTSEMEAEIVDASSTEDKQFLNSVVNGDFETLNDKYLTETKYNTGVKLTDELRKNYNSGDLANKWYTPSVSVPGWETTHWLSDPTNGNSYTGHKTTEIWAKPMEVVNTKKWQTNFPNSNLGAELSADKNSSIFQEVSTVPGKIYYWSMKFGSRSNTSEKVAVVLGPAVLKSSEANGKWLDITQSGVSAKDGKTASAIDSAKLAKTQEINSPFKYGINENTYFKAVYDQAGISTAGSSKAVEYPPGSGNTYYVYIADGTGTNGQFKKHEGYFTVPKGQGVTAFSYVWVSGGSDSSSGNIVDDVEFEQGQPISINVAQNYSAENSVVVQTKKGFIYSILENRNGELKFDEEVKTTEQYASEKPYNYFYPGPSTDTGTIKFENLTSGKKYRIVGIPEGAVNASMNANCDPRDVLDPSYYKEFTSWSGQTPKDSKNGEQTGNITTTSSAPQIRVNDTDSEKEYALVEVNGDGTVLDGNGTTNGLASYDAENGSGNVSRNGWVSGSGEYVTFKNLELGRKFKVLEREKVSNPSPSEKYPNESLVGSTPSGEIHEPKATSEITVHNTKAKVEYALIDLDENGHAKAHPIGEVQSAKVKSVDTNTEGRFASYSAVNAAGGTVESNNSPESGSKVGWINGEGETVRFYNLTPGTDYGLIARPVGYTEKAIESFQNISCYDDDEDPENTYNGIYTPIHTSEYDPAVTVADLLKSQVGRTVNDTNTDNISISGTGVDRSFLEKEAGWYAVIDLISGTVVDVRNIVAGSIPYSVGVGANQYVRVVRTVQAANATTPSGTTTTGIRCYPRDRKLDIDYLKEFMVQMGSDDTVENIHSTMEYVIMKGDVNDSNFATKVGDENYYLGEYPEGADYQKFKKGDGTGKVALSTILNQMEDEDQIPNATIVYRKQPEVNYVEGDNAISTNQYKTFPCRPQAPSRDVNYIVDYKKEEVRPQGTQDGIKVTVGENSWDINGETIGSGTEIGFKDLGWNEISPLTLTLQVSGSQAQEKFASKRVEQVILARPQAPALKTAENTNGIYTTRSGTELKAHQLLVNRDYESSINRTTWDAVTELDEDNSTFGTAKFDFREDGMQLLRYAAIANEDGSARADEQPASFDIALTNPLYAVDIKENIKYKQNLGDIKFPIYNADMDFSYSVESCSVEADNAPFTITSVGSDFSVPKAESENSPGKLESYHLVKKDADAVIPVGGYHAEATWNYMYGQDSQQNIFFSAVAYLNVEKIDWWNQTIDTVQKLDNNGDPIELTNTDEFPHFEKDSITANKIQLKLVVPASIEAGSSGEWFGESPRSNATWEYSLDDGYDWISINKNAFSKVGENHVATIEKDDCVPESDYKVKFRIKEDANHFASKEVEQYFYTDYAKPTAADFSIDYVNESVSWTKGLQLSIGDVSYGNGVLASAVAGNLTKSYAVDGNSTFKVTLVRPASKKYGASEAFVSESIAPRGDAPMEGTNFGAVDPSTLKMPFYFAQVSGIVGTETVYRSYETFKVVGDDIDPTPTQVSRAGSDTLNYTFPQTGSYKIRIAANQALKKFASKLTTSIKVGVEIGKSKTIKESEVEGHPLPSDENFKYFFGSDPTAEVSAKEHFVVKKKDDGTFGENSSTGEKRYEYYKVGMKRSGSSPVEHLYLVIVPDSATINSAMNAFYTPENQFTVDYKTLNSTNTDKALDEAFFKMLNDKKNPAIDIDPYGKCSTVTTSNASGNTNMTIIKGYSSRLDASVGETVDFTVTNSNSMTQSVTLIIDGRLYLKEKPNNINFGGKKLLTSGSGERYFATYDNSLVVVDSRLNKTAWKLNLTISQSHTNGTNVLDKTGENDSKFEFVKPVDATTVQLSSTKTTVFEKPAVTGDNVEEYKLSDDWGTTTARGISFLLKANDSNVIKGTFNGKFKWSLETE